MKLGYTGEFGRMLYDGTALSGANVKSTRDAWIIWNPTDRNKNGDCVSNSAEDFQKNVIDNIINHIPNRKKMIDIGCGNGRHSFLLSYYFDEILAIDVAPEWKENKHKPYFFDKIPPKNIKKIRFLNKNFLIPQEEKFYNSVQSFSEDKFDLILFWGSFYQMINWEAALKKCYNILSESGIIIIGESLNKRNDRPCPSNLDVSSGSYNLGDLIEMANLEEVTEYIFDYRVVVLRKKR